MTRAYQYTKQSSTRVDFPTLVSVPLMAKLSIIKIIPTLIFKSKWTPFCFVNEGR